MKVALLGLKGDFSKNTGMGIQRYMYELYNKMHKMQKGIDKVEISPIKYIGNGLSFSFKTFFMDFNNYDIVHNLMPIKFSASKRSKKYILFTTAHDFQPILYPEFTLKHEATIKDKIWINFVVNPGLENTLKSDYLIADSTQTKEEAIKLGFSKERIFVVNLGIDNRFIKSKNSRISDKSNFRVGYIGAMRLRKNVGFAIKAMNLIKDKNISFDIYGKKEFEYEYLTTLVKNNNIQFKGFAPEKDLVKIYDSFDAFVFPSFHEGFGMPILEAQSRGLPVIIYKYSKIPKEVRKYCFEAESPEHMAWIIENLKENGYNEKLQKKTIEYTRSFTWEKTANKTLQIYSK